MLSSPRRPATTIRIFSSAEYCLRVRRRMSRTVASAPSFKPFNFWLIFVPFGRCDEPEILRYANPSICSVGADVRHLAELDPIYCDCILARWERVAKDDAEQLLPNAALVTLPPRIGPDGR